MSNTTDKSEKELTFEVTEADYKEGLANGWTDDDMMKPGTYKVRRATRFSRPKPEELTLKLDGDVLDFLRRRSDEPCEKQINSELRKLMEQEKLKAA